MTEFFDTPGLKDRDQLDVMHQTGIEDLVRTVARFNAIILAVSVDNGMDSTVFEALSAYEELFVKALSEMLVVVLTVNREEPESELQMILKSNSRALKKVSYVKKERTFCVSLADVRKKRGQSYTHEQLRNLLSLCRTMDEQVVSTVSDLFNSVKKGFEQKRVEIEQAIILANYVGWMWLEEILRLYENAKYAKMFDLIVEGFIINDGAILNGGVTGAIKSLSKKHRITTIGVKPIGQRAAGLWFNLKNKYLQCNNDSGLLRLLGTEIDRETLGLTIEGPNSRNYLTLRVHRYTVFIFDPTNEAQEQLMRHTMEVSQSHADDLDKDLIDDLLEINIVRVVNKLRKPKMLKLEPEANSSMLREGYERRAIG